MGPELWCNRVFSGFMEVVVMQARSRLGNVLKNFSRHFFSATCECSDFWRMKTLIIASRCQGLTEIGVDCINSGRDDRPCIPQSPRSLHVPTQSQSLHLIDVALEGRRSDDERTPTSIDLSLRYQTRSLTVVHMRPAATHTAASVRTVSVSVVGAKPAPRRNERHLEVLQSMLARFVKATAQCLQLPRVIN